MGRGKKFGGLVSSLRLSDGVKPRGHSVDLQKSIKTSREVAFLTLLLWLGISAAGQLCSLVANPRGRDGPVQ